MPAPGPKDAVQLAARKAAAVFRDVLRGPPAPCPAGYGADLEALRQALPLFHWRELTIFANHFGQRGSVVADVAAELACEIGRRSAPASAASSFSRLRSGDGEHVGGHGSANAAEALPEASAREVAAIVYSFSKLRPQLPEYAPAYDFVARGIRRGTWAFSRLQASLIGTALADAGKHLSDALPAVVRPVLRQLRDEPEASAELTIDELRYLVHACARVPRPGLTSEEVQVLGRCTERLIEFANFSRAAHLAASWLLLDAPPAAKEAHLSALCAACTQLHDQRPQEPAHPLPAEGLAAAVAALLAREGRQDPPPLTPPRLRKVVRALTRVSEVLCREAASRSRSLSFTDWVQMAPLIIDFCEVHGAAPEEVHMVGEARMLPGWAAHMLGHIVSKARAEGAEGAAPVDLHALLALLRLLRHYRPVPAPDERFFLWAAKQLSAHRDVGSESGDLLAEAVGELVPRLPEAERGRLARVLLARSRESTSITPALMEGAPAATQHAWSPKLLSAATQLRESQSRAADITLAGVPSPRVMTSAASSARGHVGSGRLWGLLSKPGQTAAMRRPELSIVAELEANSEVSPAVVEVAAQADRTKSSDPAVARCQLAQTAEAMPAAALQPGAAAVAELAARLERALERVDVLEARLEHRERKKQAASCSSTGQAERLGADTMGHQPPAFGGWGSGAVFGGSLGNPAMATANVASEAVQLHLHRPFNFEAFRRANSARLQAERLRVLMPPDHFPMWPLPKK